MMKNQSINQSVLKTILVFLVLVFASNLSHAQIKVQSDGDVGIGTTSPSYPLEVLGQTKIRPNTSSSWGLLFDNSGPSSVATLRPSNSGWHGSLGTSSYYFGYSYVHHMYSQELHSENVTCDDLTTNSTYTFSDENIKSNIKEISKPFQILEKLEGKSYDLLAYSQGLKKDKEKKEKQQEYGFIAQEFMEVLPELTKFDSTNNLYAINYIGVIPILVEALKEQQETIETMSKQISSMSSNTKSAFISSGSETLVDETNNDASLSQNFPNPFSENTLIEMYIPKSITYANLYIYNMQGKQISQYKISEREYSSITIDGFNLEAGMYLYTLIADGKEVDTKKMILTK